MNPNDFRLFLEVAELGSFTKVAAQRHTVQSHISRQVSELEQQCGGALFRRTGRGVVLTELGRHVEGRVRTWLRDTDRLLTDIRADAGVPMGAVRVAVLCMEVSGWRSMEVMLGSACQCMSNGANRSVALRNAW